MTYVISTFQQMDYLVHYETMSPTQYGTPQSRSRIYMILIDRQAIHRLAGSGGHGGGPADFDILASMKSCFNLLKVPARPLQEYLLPSNDPTLLQWSSTLEPAAAPASRTKWTTLHQQVIPSLLACLVFLHPFSMPWPELALVPRMNRTTVEAYAAEGLPWPGTPTMTPALAAHDIMDQLSVLTARERDGLLLLLATQGDPSNIEGEMAADIYHSVTRVRFRSVAPCVLPRSRTWLFRAKRLLSPPEYFLLQDWDLERTGFPVKPALPGSRRKRKAEPEPFTWSRAFLQDLAGNSFNGSCISVAVLVLLVHGLSIDAAA